MKNYNSSLFKNKIGFKFGKKGSELGETDIISFGKSLFDKISKINSLKCPENQKINI